MPFNFTIPRPNGQSLALALNTGEYMFVLGPNGSGKSSLMQFINHQIAQARRISAHRQTWFQQNALNMTASQRRNYESGIQSSDRQWDSRWKDDYANQRSDVAVYDLIDADNVRARGITAAVDGDDFDLAKTLRKVDAPIKVINQLLQLSNLPITIEVRKHEEVVATKSGSQPYSIAELSDGERNALLLAANVLTVKPETLLLIDEPERHLHRSIISPLLTLLFRRRPDCAFVISTHEVMLPLDSPGARTLLLRGCTYQSRNNVTAWDVDELPTDSAIAENLMRDILGGRRKIIFIEGTESSLDKPLYSLLFPDVSIIAKSSCRDVEHAVSGIRDAGTLHWVQPFGIVDNDGRSQEEIERFKAKGIYALSVYAVESIYYHAEIQKRVAGSHAAVTGDEATELVKRAKSAALAAVTPHVQRLAERVAERTIRDAMFRQLPGKAEVAQGKPINLQVDIASHVRSERDRLRKLIDAGNLAGVIGQYPVRETPALTEITTKLGFRDRAQYESAVRKLIMDDVDALELVRSLFGTLTADLAGA